MKWFFALNQAALNAQPTYWRGLIRTALASARRRTRLEPHCIFDGEPCGLTEMLTDLGVGVIHHRVSVYDALRARGGTSPGFLQIAAGAYLRVDIPVLCPDDERVLYTDCDVLFTAAPDLGLQPELFACAPEFEQNDLAKFNSGVMLMNLPALRRDHAAFTDYIRTRVAQSDMLDQDAYREFYAGRVTPLPLELNWRPYWGVNPNAAIVHFHGPKPQHARRWVSHPEPAEAGELQTIFAWNPEGYRHYLAAWDEVAAPAGAALD